MAITNAQQYQQLVNKPANGKRPGYRGDAAYGPSSRSNQATSMRAATSSKSVSPGGGNSRRGSTVSLGDGKASGTPVRYDQKTALDAAVKVANEKPKGILNRLPSSINLARSVINNIPFIKKQLETNRIDFIKDQYPEYYDEEEGLVGLPANLQNLYDQGKLSSQQAQDVLMNMTAGDMNFSDYMATVKGSPALKYSGNVGNLEKIKNPDGTFSYIEKRGDGDGMSDYERRLLALEQSMSPTTEPEVDPDSLEGMLANRVAYRFMADGGMTNDAPVEGGIMDLESGRQMYFLGKLVKKATRAIKKIVKSPIGKLGLGALAFGGATGGFGASSFLRKTLLPKLYSGGKMTGLGKIALGGALTAAPLLFQEEEEEPDYANNRGPGLDINAIRSNPYNTMGSSYRFFAEGGDVEPVAKETMPLIDMDGKEMDLRADGGFVPIGRMERADDVPARLSKNEFVFTADAVRNAGEGDIDKGAEVMYNMMKNLESGGEVSEESQGLDGARDMFQTSKRLEEVL